jgi:hypothetical protein
MANDTAEYAGLTEALVSWQSACRLVSSREYEDDGDAMADMQDGAI